MNARQRKKCLKKAKEHWDRQMPFAGWGRTKDRRKQAQFELMAREIIKQGGFYVLSGIPVIRSEHAALY